VVGEDEAARKVAARKVAARKVAARKAAARKVAARKVDEEVAVGETTEGAHNDVILVVDTN
jgi:hypothetical protein